MSRRLGELSPRPLLEMRTVALRQERARLRGAIGAGATHPRLIVRLADCGAELAERTFTSRRTG